MVSSNQITPGMILKISGKLYRVESSVKVTVPKGTPFIKTKLRDLDGHKILEKNFKPNQQIEDVALKEKPLEYLYLEGNNYLFLDITNLEKVFIPSAIVGENVNFLKEGVALTAQCFGDDVYAVELPQFLELMVANIDEKFDESSGDHLAILETGARVQVPLFIEIGDIIKVDTKTGEYIQRV